MRVQLHAWERGLKTGLYYLRTQAPAYPLPYGVGRIAAPAPAPVLSDDAGKAVDSGSVGEELCESCAA